MLSPNELGANTLINARGTICNIQTNFYLAKDAVAGDTSIIVNSSIGLDVADTLSLRMTNPANPFEIVDGGEEISITSIQGDTITLQSPLTTAYPKTSALHREYSIKAVPLIKSTDVTREDVEFIRRLRVRKDLLATYGSQVYYQNRWFFVTGYDRSDLTLLLKLREIGDYVSIISSDRMGKDNGYEFDRDNPSYKYTGIKCWFTHLSSSADITDPGFLPDTYQMVVIPAIVRAEIGDYIIRGSDGLVFRITGKDEGKITNFTNLTVNIDTATDLTPALEQSSEPNEPPPVVTPIVPEIPPGVIDNDW